MQISDKLKEYLVNSLMKDKENLEREVKIKEDIIAKLGVEHGKEKTLTEDWKHKYFKLEEENCELKKKVKRLENDKTFHINELQKNNNAVKECEELNKKLKESVEKFEETKTIYGKVLNSLQNKTNECEGLKKELLEVRENSAKQYKELLDKYEIATAMNKSALNEKEKVKRGRPAKEVK